MNGTVSLVNGQITFTPDADYSGAAAFDYTVSDGKSGTDTGTVTVDVTAVQEPPVGPFHLNDLASGTNPELGFKIVGEALDDSAGVSRALSSRPAREEHSVSSGCADRRGVHFSSTQARPKVTMVAKAIRVAPTHPRWLYPSS